MSMDTEKTPQTRDTALEEETFLTRWTRLKRESNENVSMSPSMETTQSENTNNISHLTDADMPPLDSLNEDSDYSGFFSPKVSEELRQLALRKLFQSTVFNFRDGLDDYDEDFTSFAKLGDIITADMRHQLEREAERLKQVAEAEVTDTPSDKTQHASDNIESDQVNPEADNATTTSAVENEPS